MPPLTVHWTTSFPNPRRDINPSPRILVVAYTSPNAAFRLAVFAQDEPWRAILPRWIAEDLALFTKAPKRVTI